jgi:Zn-dependent protease
MSPLVWGAFSVVPEGDVPPGIRAGVVPVGAELARLGFVAAGFMQGIELLPELPRHFAVFVHPHERAFATVAFNTITPPFGPCVDFVTLFEDGRWVFTVRGRRHVFLADFTSGRLVDALVATLAEEWQVHRQAVAEEGTRARRAPEPTELAAFRAARDGEELQLAVAQGDVVATDDPRRFAFTRTGAARFVARTRQGQASAAALPGDTTYLRIPLEEQERHYRQLVRQQELARRPRPLRDFALSAIAFVASMTVFTNLRWIATLIPVLLFHELGHFVAMRALGHRDARIAFIPFFGAATMTNKRFGKLWHEIVVLLAGPLPGIGVGAVLALVGLRTHRPFLFGAAGVLLALNVLNLLPLVPFDGGRIVHALVTAGRPRISLLFKMIAAATFLAAAVWLKEPVFLLLAVVGGVALLRERQLASLEREVRRQPAFATARSEAERRAVIFATLAPKAWRSFAEWMQTVRALEVPLGHATPGRWSALLAGLLYVGGFVAAGVGVARFVTEPMPGWARCPARDQARPVVCEGDFADVGWQPASPPAAPKAPHRPRPLSSFTAAAFVWCEPGDATATRALGEHLGEAQQAADYCAALPWEPTADATEERRRERARSSLRKLSEAAGGAPPDEAAAAVAALLAHDPTVDSELARLYLVTERPGPDASADAIEAAHEAIGERLGRPAAKRCERARISDLVVDPFGDDKDGRPQLHFGLRLGTSTDFAPLGRFLCAAGCRLQLLPADPNDRRLDVCY